MSPGGGGGQTPEWADVAREQDGRLIHRTSRVPGRPSDPGTERRLVTVGHTLGLGIGQILDNNCR